MIRSAGGVSLDSVKYPTTPNLLDDDDNDDDDEDCGVLLQCYQ